MTDYMQVVGQVIAGDVDGTVIIRQRAGGKLRLGDLLTCESDSGPMLMQVYAVGTGSQLSERVKEMMSGTMLAGPKVADFYEPETPIYRLAEAKLVFVMDGDEFGAPKGTVDPFTQVRRATAKDMSFMEGPGHGRVHFGKVRSGNREMSGDGLWLDSTKTVTHHMLVAASTGRGKSNFVKCMLWRLMSSGGTGMLVLDSHREYGGLISHPRASERLTYYTSSRKPRPGTISLKVNVRSVRPSNLHGVVDITDAQDRMMNTMYDKHGDLWIERLEEAVKADQDEDDKQNGSPVTRDRLLSKVRYALGLTKANSVFSTESGVGSVTIKDIVDRLAAGQVVVVDTVGLSQKVEQTIGNMLAGAVLNKYKLAAEEEMMDSLPPVGVILEEAPRVLADANNSYSEIAREGRKFKVGLVAVTQIASDIPESVMANLSTKVIFGNEAYKERKTIIESAAQDMSKDSRSIATLTPGEAIVTSFHTPFAVPIKVQLFEDLVKAESKPPQKVRVVG